MIFNKYLRTDSSFVIISLYFHTYVFCFDFLVFFMKKFIATHVCEGKGLQTIEASSSGSDSSMNYYLCTY